eukprot:s2477_g18.t1
MKMDEFEGEDDFDHEDEAVVLAVLFPSASWLSSDTCLPNLQTGNIWGSRFSQEEAETDAGSLEKEKKKRLMMMIHLNLEIEAIPGIQVMVVMTEIAEMGMTMRMTMAIAAAAAAAMVAEVENTMEKSPGRHHPPDLLAALLAALGVSRRKFRSQTSDYGQMEKPR